MGWSFSFLIFRHDRFTYLYIFLHNFVYVLCDCTVYVDWSQFKSLARFFFVRVWWSFFVHNHDPIDDAEWQLWDHPKRFNFGSWFRTRTLYLVIQVVFYLCFFLFWLHSVLKSGKKTNSPPNREQGSKESVLKPVQYIILFIWNIFKNF